MGHLVETKQNSNGSVKPSSVPKVRYMIGDSNTYFEPDKYLVDTGKVNVGWVKRALTQRIEEKVTALAKTDGKSLKLMLQTENEIKKLGFVTAGNAKLTLDEDDIPTILEHDIDGDIVLAITADEVADLI